MMISTKGRYALRVMVDLAENGNGGYVALKTIAERQDISLKYLERILPVLTKNGLIEGIQGKGGGYRLCRKPAEYTVGEILNLTEGRFSSVTCLESGECKCDRAGECRTLRMWQGLQALVDDYFDGITIADLMIKK